MKTFHFATAAVLAIAAIAPTAVAQSSLSSLGSSSSSSRDSRPAASTSTSAKPKEPQLNVRDVYSCPTPEKVQGQASWKIYNTSGLALTVYVADDAGNAYQVLERVGTPAKRAWAPKLQDGTYHLTCVFHNDSAVKSDDFAVTGSTITDAPKMVPITDREVAAVAIQQAARQKKRVPELQKKAHALAEATSKDRRAAQAAYLDYLETYRSFDDSSEMWPGPGLEGYRDVEKLLWSRRPVKDAAKPARALADAVDKTARALDTSHFAIPAPDYGLRTHEVMEEFERFDMRGERDFGAHALPTALRGDVISTRLTLDAVRSLVEGRGLDTSPIYEQLDELDKLATKFDEKYDTAFDKWSQKDRMRVQSAVARANELLAPVATMTVVRRMD
ncbi:EfeM/EfeO family lipoprotein [Corynebacterium kefirresidentii]|uniref:EfeM/EfeO family lipoprotein n=1 Tax=Corynebacterium TaxID=1716 RepID=UPI001EF2128C|nr:EfeM/EfeO family lipoprotein [Corynebacterium kefirresidentii]MCG7449723.1 EfeM/EfeO family lipoprotein [Corynebacterium kefirresidentii]MCG7451844.1 EfeM/EfeO family lipoprotein [Corynebacterium kefirresidentii]MDN8633555.1 EfeM/EfeO family lipoprotein [Corynebacterium kefirresidentii]